MSLAHIAPADRSRLRLHGWLLFVWVVVVGFLTSTLLLRGFHVHSMLLRYGVSAGAVYFVGLLGGGWWYVRWWKQQPGNVHDVPQHAHQQDIVAYQQHETEIGNKFNGWGDVFNIGPLGDDPLSAILAVILAVLCVFFVLLLLGYLPYFATEALAGFLAEVVLEFVIGVLLVRRILRPRNLDSYWHVMLRKTLIAGVLFIVVCALLGWGLQTLNPQAQTLLQVF